MQSYKYNYIHGGVALLIMLFAVAFVFHNAAQLKIRIRNWLAEKMEFTKIKFGGKPYIFQYMRDRSSYFSSYGGCAADTPLEGQIAGQGSIKVPKMEFL